MKTLILAILFTSCTPVKYIDVTIRTKATYGEDIRTVRVENENGLFMWEDHHYYGAGKFKRELRKQGYTYRVVFKQAKHKK